MRDYERLRKALDDLRRMLTWETYTDYDLETMRLIVQRGLADTPETSEMERLVEWLKSYRDVLVSETEDRGLQGIFNGVVQEIIEHIHTEFGYGEEQDGE